MIHCSFMKLALVALCVFCLCVSGADKKKKPPDVQVIEMKVRREGDRVTVDGRVRATGEKPIRRLVLALDFLASGSTPISTRRAEVDEDTLNPGDEGSVHAEASYPTNSLRYLVRAYGGDGRELEVANPGPYPILD